MGTFHKDSSSIPSHRLQLGAILYAEVLDLAVGIVLGYHHVNIVPSTRPALLNGFCCRKMAYEVNIESANILFSYCLQ